MMQIYINFYGQLKELDRSSEITISLTEQSNREKLLDALEKHYLGFHKFRKYVMCAVNDEFIDSAYTLKDGDHVDILPPTSGG